MKLYFYPNAALNSIFVIYLLLTLTNHSCQKFNHTLRFIEENKFLQDDILKAEKNNLIQNYLSTRYLYWNKGIRGQGVKIGIFDSGIANSYINCNIKKNYDFTNDVNSTKDSDPQGHGTYIASLICSEQIGISPMSEIYNYKIFTKSGITNEKWVSSAIKQGIDDKVDIMNLSFGGINFNDRLIVELITEAINKGIIITVSAGNEGPSYGSIIFPGNLPQVITVGSVSSEVFSVYKYSSRGPAIYNKNTLINKPNTWCLGEDIVGFTKDGSKVIKNGSSIATGIVSAFIALGKSYDKMNKENWNIGKVMKMIYDSNLEIVGINKGEYGSGLFNPEGFLGLLNMNEQIEKKSYIRIYNNEKRYSEEEIDEEETDDETGDNIEKEKYNNSLFELYSTKQNITLTLTVLNELSSSKFNEIILPLKISLIDETKKESEEDKELEENETESTQLIEKCFIISILNSSPNISHVFLLQLEISPLRTSKCEYYKEYFDWTLQFSDQSGKYSFTYDLYFNYIPKPSKLSRILLDRNHNLIFPLDGYVPKDDLLAHSYDYDWTYENIDTNYFSLYKFLKEEGYYFEEANTFLTNIAIEEYSVLFIIDTEKKYSDIEIKYIQYHFEKSNVALFIITEWNNPTISSKLHNEKLNDTFQNGSDIKNLNSILLKYKIAISQNSLSGQLYFQNKKIQLTSANSISLFPQNGILFGGYLNNDEQFVDSLSTPKINSAVLGLYESKNEEMGRIAIFTDTYCIDDYQLGYEKDNDNCFWLIQLILRYLIHGNYAYNDLNLMDKKSLSTMFYNFEPITYDEVQDSLLNYEKFVDDLERGNLITTNEIPNELNSEFENVPSIIDNGSIIEIIKGVLAVFIPILAILIVMFIVIQCKAKDYKKRRIFAIRSLGEMRPISYHNLEERKRLNSISSINSSTRLGLELKLDVYK